MVGSLISMKFAMLSHSPLGMRLFGWIGGAVLVLATWAAAVLASGSEVRAEVLSLLLAGWFVGAALGPVTMSGAGVIRGEHLLLLPLDRRRIALGVLATVFPGVASGYLLLAYLAVVVHAIGLEPGAEFGAVATSVIVAVITSVLAWIVTVVVSRLIYAGLGSAMRTWLGVEIAAIQFGFLLAAVLAGWMIVAPVFQAVPELISSGLSEPAVVAVLAVLPSAWPLRAVEAAAVGEVGGASVWVAALLGTAALTVAAAAYVLRPSLGPARSGARRRSTGRLPALRSDSMLGAVIGKEVRQWLRDPWRTLEWRSGIYTGLIIGIAAWVSNTFQSLAPLAGLVIVFMMCLSGCNVFGQDGTAIWLSVVGQRAGTVVAEVRGRQLAMIMLFAPPAASLSVVMIIISGQSWAWPVLLAGLPALVGSASGLGVLMSAVAVSPGVDPRRRVGPNDAGGDLTVQAMASIFGCTILITPTAAAIVIGLVALPGWGPWVAVLVGLVNGLLVGYGLGRLTIGYLTDRLPTVFTKIRYGRSEGPAVGGLLGAIESAAQKAEEDARAAKAKAKTERVLSRTR